VAGAIEIKLDGLETTLRRLQAFPVKVQKKCLRSAVAAGAVPLVRAAKSASPQRTGIFRRSLASKLKSYQSGAVYVSIVGQADKIRSSKKVRARRGGISGRGGNVPIHFIENLTRPHRIPLRDYVLRQLETTKAFRDFQRQQGKDPRVYKRVWREKPLAIHLPAGVLFRWYAQHPGTGAQHIIRKAAETAGREAADRVERKLSELIDRLEVTE
jgi:hypothetical protein